MDHLESDQPEISLDLMSIEIIIHKKTALDNCTFNFIICKLLHNYTIT